jgi:hypothetical protein
MGVHGARVPEQSEHLYAAGGRENVGSDLHSRPA